MEGETEAQRSLYHTANLGSQLSSCDAQFIDFFFFSPVVWSFSWYVQLFFILKLGLTYFRKLLRYLHIMDAVIVLLKRFPFAHGRQLL